MEQIADSWMLESMNWLKLVSAAGCSGSKIAENADIRVALVGSQLKGDAVVC